MKSFFRSFGYAFRGLSSMRKGERNFKVQLTVGFFAAIAAFYFPLTNAERAVILVCIGLVLAAEIMNSALERLVNLVEPNYNKKAAEVKDLAAAAVLVLSFTSVIVGLVVFIPHLLLLH